jgi:DNA-binding CsgD family transcriptional regulator
MIRRLVVFLGLIASATTGYSQSVVDFFDLQKTPYYGLDTITAISHQPEPEGCINLSNWAAANLTVYNAKADFKAAKELYERVEKQCLPDFLLSSFHFSKSITQYCQQDFNGAIKSLKLSESKLHPNHNYVRKTLYLNMGSAYNQLSMLDSYIVELIDINNLETNRRLKDYDRAKAIFERIKDRSIPSGGNILFVRALLDYCLDVADTASFLEIGGRFANEINAANELLPAKYSILLQHLEDGDDEASELWETMAKSTRGGRSSDENLPTSIVEQELSEKFERWRFAAIVLASVMLLALLVSGYILLRRFTTNRALKEFIGNVRNDLSSDKNVQKIRNALEGSVSKKDGFRALAEMDYLLSLYKTSDTQLKGIPWYKFDATEAEIMKLLIARKSVTEIAELRNCSAGHVYNVKTAIRKKMGLSGESKALEKWLLTNT